MSEFRMTDSSAGLTTADHTTDSADAGAALAASMAAGVLAQASAAAAATTRPGSSEVLPWRFPVTVDRSRDALLTDFGKDTLDDRYLLPGESYQDLFARVAAA